MNTIVNIAAYKFVALDNLQPLRDRLRRLSLNTGLRGTILISTEGINLFLAGEREAIDRVLSEIRAVPQLSDLSVKESLTDYQPFNRMIVKIKREIIPVGIDGITPEPMASPKIAPQELKRWLDEKRPVALLDTRNDYEISLGTFEGAVDLNLKTFRQFPKAAAALPDEIKKQPVVMFCTGGIRCEKIGPYMKGLGFEQIYQLEGGILKYFEECEQAHYNGDCFVFDQRVTVDPHLDPGAADECFACKHPLLPEDTASPLYVIGRSCPYCYRSPEQKRLDAIARHQASLVQIAAEQRGCVPYENSRWVSMPQHVAGMQLIDALMAAYPSFGRDAWLTAIERGELASPQASAGQLSTQAVVANQSVKEGERFLHRIPNYVEPPVSDKVSLVHEDDAIVVVNKGAPLPVHPSGRFNKNTLQTILMSAYHPEKLRPAHRLDANTTGVVVFSRRMAFASRLQTQFSSGSVEKTYLVRVVGLPEWNEIECSLAIDSEPLPNGGRRLSETGQPSCTRFVVVKREADGTAILEASPITGRTHQIRLHAAALGYPVVNDPLYLVHGESRSVPDVELAKQPIGLHSWKIAFIHPQTNQPVEFESKPDWLT